jgi:hypothetical protein
MSLRHSLLATLLVAALPAAAQDRPPLQPTRDVSVTYRFEGAAPGPGGPPVTGEMRLSWLASEQKMRMDPPGNQGWMVTDTRSGATFMVQDQARMVMQLPRDAAMPNPALPPPGMTFTRGGTETLLGQRCTIWTMKGNDGEGEACVTADGVMLRSRGTAQGQSGGMVATRVDFAPQDPARFQVPQGYQTMQMPGMPGGGAPGGAARPPGAR